MKVVRKPRRGVMFIETGNKNFEKLRRSGMQMSPLTGLDVD